MRVLAGEKLLTKTGLEPLVYIKTPCTFTVLKENLHQEIPANPANLKQYTFASLEHRVQLCVDTGVSEHYVKGCSFTKAEVCTIQHLFIIGE